MDFRKSFAVLAGITLLGFGLRAYKLTASPAGLYIDETSIGYNAFSLITTGRDEHGKSFPLFFEAFGEYKLPVYIYFVAATQLIIGPSDLSVRLPAVIFGTLTIPAIYFLTRELVKNTNKTIESFAPSLSAFLISASPWHFQFTRPGFEASIALFFLVFALYLFFRAKRSGSSSVLTFSILSFVLTLYSYNSARIVTPLVLFTLLIFYFKEFSLVSWVKSLMIGAVVALPFIIFSISPEGLARARITSIFFEQNETGNLFLKIFENYWTNISPFYLFGRGDPTIAHLTPHRMSLLHLVELPFFFVGLILLFLKRSRNRLLILTILLVGFIPPTISILNPHALRAILALPTTIFISSLGISYLIALLKNQTLRRLFLGIYVMAISLSTLRFINIYHNKYVLDAGWDWQTDAKEAARAVRQLEQNYEGVYFSGGLRNIAILWYLKIDPVVYQASVNKNYVGKYHFEVNYWKSIPVGNNNLYVTNASLPSGKLLKYVYYPNGKIAYGIWEI